MSAYQRLLDVTVISGNVFQPVDEAWDAGNYRELSVLFRVLNAGGGTNARLRLQHAAVNVEGAFVDLTIKNSAGNDIFVEASLDQTGPIFVRVPGFLRYLRWVVVDFSGNPATVLIEVVAKN